MPMLGVGPARSATPSVLHASTCRLVGWLDHPERSVPVHGSKASQQSPATVAVSVRSGQGDHGFSDTWQQCGFGSSVGGGLDEHG